MQNQHRQLAAILFTDIIGYTALMQENEQKAVALIRHYNTALNELVGLHNGKVLNYYGDGSLCTFPSVTEALNCAIELQKELQAEPTVPLRIGLHVGEVFFENEKALGDGVNVASRIQSLGQSNTILYSKEIFDKIRNQPEFKSVSLGLFEFKNVDQPMEVFALANEGLNVPKKETMEGKLKTALTKNNKTVWRKIIAAASIVLLLAAGFFIYSMFLRKSGFTGKEKSIAVLPFANMSSDKENEYFSDGLTEEINTRLSKIAAIKVIAPNSAKSFKDSKKSFKEIAEELGVSSLLKGSVRRSENDIRITTQLIDANTQEQIWTNTWNREFKEIFAIQSEVAQEIAHQLKAKLTTEEKKNIEKKPTNNPEAYKYYLQASHLGGKFFETFNKDYYENSKVMYEKAISADPNYVMAYAGLADLYNTYYLIDKDSSLLALQNKNIKKAWSIDSTLDFVNLIQGYVFQADAKFEDAYKCFSRAVEVAPNNTSNLYGLSQMLSNFGLVDEAKILIEKSIKLNPLNATDFASRGVIERWLFNLDSAINDFQTTLKLEPNSPYAIISLGEIYCMKNRPEEATNAIRKYEKLNQKIEILYPLQAYIYAKLGEKKRALELSNDWQVYLALGMKEKLLTALLKSDSDSSKRFYLNDYILLKNYSRHKDFEIIRNDPRFIALMEKKRIEYEINKKKFSIAEILN